MGIIMKLNEEKKSDCVSPFKHDITWQEYIVNNQSNSNLFPSKWLYHLPRLFFLALLCHLERLNLFSKFNSPFVLGHPKENCFSLYLFQFDSSIFSIIFYWAYLVGLNWQMGKFLENFSSIFVTKIFLFSIFIGSIFFFLFPYSSDDLAVRVFKG